MIDLTKPSDRKHKCCALCTDLDSMATESTRTRAHKALSEWKHSPKSMEPNPIPTLPNVTFSFE